VLLLVARSYLCRCKTVAVSLRKKVALEPGILALLAAIFLLSY
jgi:hypothetical protein